METAQNVLEQALKMRPADRFLIIEGLLHSLDEADKTIEEIWAIEAEKRRKAIKAGSVKTRKLREEAQRSRQPETIIARDAINTWLKQRERDTLHQEIAAYAKAHAGSEVDLDEELELASILIKMAESIEDSAI
jgi:hypothetical protein